MSSSFISSSTIDTEKWGATFGEKLNKNSVVAFYGLLGSGKTTLVRSIIAAITNNALVTATSPTFVYLNEYLTDKAMIYHFDLYRLSEVDDFIDCGFEEYFDCGICLIEWAERIEKILPIDCIRVYLDHINANTREIRVIIKEEVTR